MSDIKYMTAEELGVQNHIVVLPYGSDTENIKAEWTAEDLKPYQYYMDNGVVVDTMFKGLIFNPISGRENYYIYPMYTDFGEMAEKTDWEIALDRLFKNGCNLEAAASNLESGNKTDIWIALPYPFENQTNFGDLHGTNINFKVNDDRYTAVEWWIKEFLIKWNAATHLHEKLTFKGFVWSRSSITESDEIIVKKVTDSIRENNFLSLWLQQYGSTGCVNWREFGFDASCTHPNFYGSVGPDFSWFANAAVFAQYYRLGMQITFGKGGLFKKNHLLDYLNYGVYNDYMKSSLLVFQFPRQTMREIYENSPIEYVYLYSFIKGAYQPIYPTAAFPS